MFPHPSRNDPEAWFELPPLEKKVIYLDQFAISNMMKAINPKMKAYQEGKVDKFWLTLFERLSCLSQMQLIVCPESSTQESESLLSSYFKALEKMYKLLSWGVRFQHPVIIRIIQLCRYAQNWYEGEPNKKPVINKQEVTQGEINAWQNLYRVEIDLGTDRPWKEDFIDDKKRIGRKMKERFMDWQKQCHKSFGDWFEEECSGVGRVIMKGYLERRADLMTKRQFNLEPDLESIYGGPVLIVNNLENTFERLGVKKEEALKQVGSLLVHDGENLRYVPFVRIFSSLCAALTNEAAHEGRQKFPDEGLYTDFDTIASLLPYCDAIFVDNECRGLLSKIPKEYKLNYPTRVFSLSNKEKFLAYLDEIESQATEKHMKAVKEVYGEDCPRPFTELYREE